MNFELDLVSGISLFSSFPHKENSKFQQFSFIKVILTHSLIGFEKWQRMGEVSQEIKRVRAQMEEDEQLAILMRGLRGQNLKDSQFAEDDVELRLVEVYM